jgi:2-keto-4-pentenoate hydratase/2-oxohepta-3-ene-1,7-dioic acid hydratase in catechol pathway
VRIANLGGRLSLLDGQTAIDVQRASGGAFGPDPQGVYDRWEEFTGWAATAPRAGAAPFDRAALGSPAPAPRQVFGIGLNYRSHASESGFEVPDQAPPVFTKFPSCITGPYGEIALPPGGHTDWEVELVAVIGRRAEQVAEADGWAHVAGLAVGQDLSERIVQMAGPSAQFSLGKSFPGFGPIGPWLVTVDEFANPDDLELGCSVNGEQMQKSRTSDMIFGVPRLLAQLSAVLPLLPGDVIFTGTPGGVGLGRNPQRWLAAGDELRSYIEGIGELRHRFVDPPLRS